MRLIGSSLFMLTLFAGLVQGASASDIMIMKPVARATLSPAIKTSAIYLSLMNHGGADDRLLSASTPAANTAEIHQTQMQGDVMQMRPIEGGLALPAGATVKLAPGGTHIMLTGLKAPLKNGDVIVLELLFEKSGPQKLDVPVGVVSVTHEHGG
jgi:periplasmic copper chaperone A